MAVHHARSERALDRGGRKIRAPRAGGKSGNEQMLGLRPLPEGRAAGMFEGDAASRIILREPAPGREIQLLGSLELAQVAFQARSFGEQPEDALLIENVHVVFPD